MASSPVRFTLQWNVRPEQGGVVTSALQSVLVAARREPGCLTCSLATELGEWVTLRFEETWETEESMRRYVRSPRFVALASLMESATEPPRVEFSLQGGIRGLDYAAEVREQAST